MSTLQKALSRDPGNFTAIMDEQQMTDLEQQLHAFGVNRRFCLLALSRSREQLSTAFKDPEFTDAMRKLLVGTTDYLNHLDDLRQLVAHAESRLHLAAKDAGAIGEITYG